MRSITEYQGSSILNLRGIQVHSMENSSLEKELSLFQKNVTDRFNELCSVSNDDLISLSWVKKLLESFLCCHEEFRMILHNHRSRACKPTLDRLVGEFYERSVKALDVCNAIRDGIEQVRQWEKLLEIVVCALDRKKVIGEGQFRRAKKALVDLAIAMIDDNSKDCNNVSSFAYRNRSFGRNNVCSEQYFKYGYNNVNRRGSCSSQLGYFRPLSWSVSRNWSATKQLQAIGNNLCFPKSSDLVATNGIALAIYTMSTILLFTMWSMVAAIPCQDRGLNLHFLVLRQLSWAAPVMSLHERIWEESKKKERKNCCGLLREIQKVEMCGRVMNELGDSLEFPLSKEKEEEVRVKIEDVVNVCEALKDGLDPLEKQVREVFHIIVRGRMEGLDST